MRLGAIAGGRVVVSWFFSGDKRVCVSAFGAIDWLNSDLRN